MHGVRATHVCDEVDTRQLLHHLSAHPQQRPVEKLLFAVREHQSERPFLRGLLLLRNSPGNLHHICIHYSIILRDHSSIGLDCPDDVTGFIVSAMRNELGLSAYQVNT